MSTVQSLSLFKYFDYGRHNYFRGFFLKVHIRYVTLFLMTMATVKQAPGNVINFHWTIWTIPTKGEP